MIYVTKPYLPDIDKFYEKIKQIWESNHLTNDGPLNKVLEKKLANYLDIEDLCLINNCTNGLLMCLNEFEPDDDLSEEDNFVLWKGYKKVQKSKFIVIIIMFSRGEI